MNLTEEQQEVFIKALNAYGIEAQLYMVVEETAEMLQALNKARRNQLIDILTNTFKKPDKNMSFQQVKAYNDLCSEVADIKIMVYQLEKMLDSERIDISVERKIDRLKKRLDKKR